MKKVSGILVVAGTHALALAAGAGLWVAGGLHSAEEGSSGKERLSSRSSMQRNVPGGRSDANRLLDRLENSLGKRSDDLAVIAGNLRKLIEAADGLEPSVDVKAAAADAMAKFDERVASGEDPEKIRFEISVRLLHWMREDPRGMIGFLGSSEEPFAGHGKDCMNNVVLAAMSQSTTSEALSWLGAEGAYDKELKWMLADKLGAATDLVGIAAFKNHFADEWTQTRGLLIGKWPINQAESFADWAASENAPELLASFAFSKGDEGGSWLHARLMSGDLSEEDKGKITASRDFRSLLWRCSNLDYDFRLGEMRKIYPDKPIERIQREMSDSDVGGALKKGRDWCYAFGRGVASAVEVLDAISKTLPESAANSPDALRDAVFRNLAEENGARALALLDGMPAEQKWDTALTAANGMFHRVNPQNFYDYLQHIPVDTSDSSVDRRLAAWNNLGKENHLRLGAFYVDWVGKLPDGIDKDMASLSLVQSVGKSDPTLARKIAEDIKDPKIRQRIPW